MLYQMVRYNDQDIDAYDTDNLTAVLHLHNRQLAFYIKVQKYLITIALKKVENISLDAFYQSNLHVYDISRSPAKIFLDCIISLAPS